MAKPYGPAQPSGAVNLVGVARLGQAYAFWHVVQRILKRLCDMAGTHLPRKGIAGKGQCAIFDGNSRDGGKG